MNLKMNKKIFLQVTTPRFSQILSSVVQPCSLAEDWHLAAQKAHFFARGSAAITAAVKQLLHKRGKSEGVIYIPDYFCNQALQFLRRLPVKIVFYPVGEKLEPNWELINPLLTKVGAPDLFVLVHYFGFKNDLQATLAFCRKVGAELIEDAAHVFLPFLDIGQHSAATIYSPYKFLPIPTLGILVLPDGDQDFEHTTKLDLDSAKWLAKRLTQSLLMKIGLSCHQQKVKPFELDRQVVFKEKSSVSLLAVKLLKVLESKFLSIKQKRQKHYKMILEAILGNSQLKPLFPALVDNTCPYLLPFYSTPDVIKEYYFQLNQAGIPAQTWPDLPPEVKSDPEKHLFANKFRNSIITLPIHQDFQDQQMKYIISALQTIKV